MKTFTIVIEETIVSEFKIKADSSEEAIRIAEHKYKEGGFVLEPGEVHNLKIHIV